jgi:hypothetical protein
LALVAFILETTRWGKPQYDNHIAFSEGLRSSFKPDRKTQTPSQVFGERASEFGKDVSIFPKETDNLPVSNAAQKPDIKVWSWPGFGHDAPKPQQKNRERHSILTPRNRGRPSRKKW